MQARQDTVLMSADHPHSFDADTKQLSLNIMLRSLNVMGTLKLLCFCVVLYLVSVLNKGVIGTGMLA